MRRNFAAAVPVLMLLSGCMADVAAHGVGVGSDAKTAQDELQAQAYMNRSCEQLRLHKDALEPAVTGPRMILGGHKFRGQYDGIVEAMRRKGCSA